MLVSWRDGKNSEGEQEQRKWVSFYQSCWLCVLGRGKSNPPFLGHFVQAPFAMHKEIL